MKRNENELNLRNAFPEMPESCYSALMDAASSVQEEEKVKKFTIRTILIAAAIMLLTGAVALAAANMLGWTDFLMDYNNVSVPNAAEQAMQVTDAESWQVGPCTFTVHEQRLAVIGHLNGNGTDNDMVVGKLLTHGESAGTNLLAFGICNLHSLFRSIGNGNVVVIH